MNHINRQAQKSLRTGTILLATILTSAVLASTTAAFPLAPRNAPAERSIYTDALAPDWADWSWDTTTDPANAAPVHSGAASYAVTHNAAWGGFYLHADPAMSTAGYTHLRFWIHGGATGGQQTLFKVNGNETDTLAVTAQANQWRLVEAALADLGNPATISDLYWQDATGGAQPTYYLDEIALVAVTPTETPTEAPTVPTSITLSVDVAAGRKPISPYIYGLNFAKEAFAAEIDLPLRRWGGNATSRYNWQTGHTNHAADWFFHNNVKYDEYTGAAQTADEWIQQNQRTGTESLITLPMNGYVAKDGDKNSCAYKVSKYGPQDAVDSDSGFPDCGNGLQNGQPINNDPLDTSIAVDENFSAGWVTHLKNNAATNGAVQFYALDNEPDIWFETHRDVAPIGWKYAEFRDLSVRYGAAVKAADPAAQLFGPVVNGWTYYWHGAYDGQRQDWETPDDRNSHGGAPFLEWYLQQMHTYEQTHGVRLLDYLTVHFYPQNGVSQTLAGNVARQALRLRSTRALWDPTYVDESWIAQAGPDGGIVKLIPRLRAWVDAHYPGTKLALTEYNWGGLEALNGALAQAEILGIFGREGLDVAALWNYPTRRNNAGEEIKYDIFETLPGAYAFRIYRNYDGQGAKFGETSVHAASSDPANLSIYAAQRSNDGSLTLVIINKTGDPLTANLSISNLSISNLSISSQAELYRYSQANLNAIQRLPDQPVTGAGFVATYPANSITLVRVPVADGASTSTPTPTPTATATSPAGATPTSTPTPTATAPAGGGNERIYLPLVEK